MNTRTRNWLIGGIVGFVVISVLFGSVAGTAGPAFLFAVIVGYFVTKPKDDEGVAA